MDSRLKNLNKYFPNISISHKIANFQNFSPTDNCIIYNQFKETAELDSRMIEQD